MIAIPAQPFLMDLIFRCRPPQAFIKGRAVVVFMQMHQFMENQIINPFRWQEDQVASEKRFSLSPCMIPSENRGHEFQWIPA